MFFIFMSGVFPGGLATVEAHSCWIVCLVGSCGWYCKCRNILGWCVVRVEAWDEVFCVCRLEMKDAALYSAFLKIGYRWVGEYPRWMRRWKNVCVLCWMSCL